MKPKIIKPRAISGFPEYSPQINQVYDTLIGSISDIFKLHGFVPLHTPIVERMEVLAAKGGDVDKEMFLLQHKSQQEGKTSQLGVRFDLTVPLARYVAQHLNDIVFPFKRFHIGSCFRGERPQDGRFRQFLQADIDVLDMNSVSLKFDCEIPAIVLKVLKQIGVNDPLLRLSNRKILKGVFEILEIENTVEVTRVLDKRDKIGSEEVFNLLVTELSVDEKKAQKCVDITAINSKNLDFAEKAKEILGDTNDVLEEGIMEVQSVISYLKAQGLDDYVVDLSITRGLDYYTGSVYEVKWVSEPSIGTISAGGRYDNLVGNYSTQSIPGVGMSIGVSRIFSKLLEREEFITDNSSSGTKALVLWLDDAGRQNAEKIGATLRSRGIAAEVYHEKVKIQKQLKYADRKGIPYVIFDTDLEVKDMSTGKQVAFDANSWNP